uniref:Envelope glycoprotein n=1 Tax=Pseudonaja textilis TaxID=8673 RepID=A0A670XU65_PSETE
MIKDAYGQILNSTTNYTMISSYFPKLHFDFAEMILGKTAYSHPADAPSPSHSIVKRYHLYVCPGHITDADHIYTCGGISDYYCKSWSCVSTGHISWTPPLKNDLITLTRTTQAIQCTAGNNKWSRCNPVTVSFTAKGKQSNIWDTGAKWGGRIFTRWPAYHYGNIFYIQRHVHLSPSLPVGPNANQIQSEFLKPLTNAQNPLVSLIASSHALLNCSQDSSIFQHWSSKPPFYEAIGSSQPISNSTSDNNCRWKNTEGYNQVFTTSGGNITKRLQGQFFIPGNNSVWACSTGLTACVHGDVLLTKKSFCIQVQLLPKIDIYDSEDFVSISEPQQYHLRTKREVVTALTLSVLLGLGATGAATGITALVVNDNSITQLNATIDADLRRIEQSIVALQNSLTSLSEVVLQNRRGLDLLFLKQGGLCAALKEECCFYADSSGVVLDSMKELDTRLKERQREREAQHTWYQGLFNFSPWLTTLVSAIAGPLILLLVLCTIGPCILGKVLAFLKRRLSQLDSNLSRTQKQVNTLISHTQEKQALLSFSSDSDKDEIIKSVGKDKTCILMHLQASDSEEEGASKNHH